MLKLRKVHLHIAAACLAAICASATAAGPVVITNPAVTLTSDDVRDVYLGEKQVAGSIKLAPVDNASSQAAFLADVIKLDATKYATAWTKKSFRDGLTPPPVKATDAEVIDFVKRTPGGVGYVASTPPSGVNVVTLK